MFKDISIVSVGVFSKETMPVFGFKTKRIVANDNF